MKIATTCLLVTLLVFIHGQVGNSHVVTVRQGTDSLKSDTPRISLGEVNDRLEFDKGSGIIEAMLNVPECPGNDFPTFTISLENPSGCYIFQSTGFNMNGYPNQSGPSYYSSYFCSYTIQFGATVSGTVTVKEKDFQFQEPDSDGSCLDYVLIMGVNDERQQTDNSDLDDQDWGIDSVQYCGTITGDKIRDFSADALLIGLSADNTENGNGAEIVICIT
ncbi:uncharacterized protein LOC131891767 [Tigriopus californicus]|uniref:uncharacterized protein LOC131891767 n=1 Tax=Tigriopus californicus TaxID=6832 RepID=UPI0027DA40AD|nr:uncharacterized protein LOC131891767 [Tigriopus californicus]XP_059097408.1 uncharacterized protein LOC131891767 [Tigriopus californicus]